VTHVVGKVLARAGFAVFRRDVLAGSEQSRKAGDRYRDLRFA
jgi:hypothetical protein